MISEAAAVRHFRRRRVLVIGDAMLDRYFLGTVSRLASEGPVPVISSRGQKYLPGGAANTAANAAALGAKTTLLAVVGDDPESDILQRALRERRVDIANVVVDPSRPTTVKLRIYAGGQVIARYDEESDEDVGREVQRRLVAALRNLFSEHDVVVVSDYMKGVVTRRLVAELADLNRNNGQVVVVDSKDLSRHRFRNVTAVTPNHLDAQRACRISATLAEEGLSEPALEQLGHTLLSQMGTRWVVMTTGAEGAVLFDRDQPTVPIRGREVSHPSVIGAGDSFTAALALSLSAGLGVVEAAHVAVEAAAIAVSKPLTSTVEQQELLERLSRWEALKNPEGVASWLESYRSQGKRLVFLSGVFDGLHSGHVALLNASKDLGDVLIVGLHSDGSVLRKTGSNPLLPEEERLAVVAALEPVDHVVSFEEDTAASLIRLIRPQVCVKSGGYTDDSPEIKAVREVGGSVVTIPVAEPLAWHALKSRLAGKAGSSTRPASSPSRNGHAGDLDDSEVGMLLGRSVIGA